MSLTLIVLLLSYPALSYGIKSDSAVTFKTESYSYVQTVDDLPRCPRILEVLYSMDTMRELTSFVDSIAMLRNEPSSQLVRISFSILGLRGKLLYERTIDRKNNTITIELKSFENNFSFVPYPISFKAMYFVSHSQGSTTVKYTQDILVSKKISFFYRMFVKNQMRGFEKKLQRIILRNCE